jgi:hypothetical protein
MVLLEGEKMFWFLPPEAKMEGKGENPCFLTPEDVHRN